MDKKMADKLMYIPNDVTQIIPSVDYNLMNQPIKLQIKVPNVDKQTNNKTL